MLKLARRPTLPRLIAGCFIAALSAGCYDDRITLRDEGLSKAFSDEVGMVSSDVGISSFVLSCDSARNNLKVGLSVLAGGSVTGREFETEAACSEPGPIWKGVDNGNGAYSVTALKSYPLEVAVSAWREQVIPQFGTLAYRRPIATALDNEFRAQFKNAKVRALAVTCSVDTKKLRYTFTYAGDVKDGRVDLHTFSGSVLTPCPEKTETGHSILRIEEARVRTEDHTTDQFGFRVAASESMDSALAVQLVNDILKTHLSPR